MLDTGIVSFEDGTGYSCSINSVIDRIKVGNTDEVGVIITDLHVYGNLHLSMDEEVSFSLTVNDLTYKMKGVYLGHGQISLQ